MSDRKQQYRRSIQNDLEEQLKFKEIVVVTGMRRVGKTTLLRMIYDSIQDNNKVFLDLENLLDQEIFNEKDFNNIWNNLKQVGLTRERRAFIFLDEIQARPEITIAVKYLYDHYDIKFFLTGSSSFYLKNLFPESLAGRKVVFELFSLDFAEFLVFKEVNRESGLSFKDKELSRNKIAYEKQYHLFKEYCRFGGFPQVVTEENETQKNRHLSDILSSYFGKDIHQMADFRNLSAIKELIRLLLPRVGSKLEITKIAHEIGVSRETIYAYLSFLEGSYFLYRISPYSTNVDREISGTKKVYFCDNGLLNLFGNVSEGALLENAVFLNLKRHGQVNYYQKRTGKEIDFVIPGIKAAFEVKKKGTEYDLRILEKQALSLNFDQYYLISELFNDFNGLILAQDL
ncbi:MAG: ATP-binding protein [Bacteroidota bacterium]